MSKKDLYIAEMRRLLDHWNEHVSRIEPGDQEVVQQAQCDNDTLDDARSQRSHASMTQTATAMPS